MEEISNILPDRIHIRNARRPAEWGTAMIGLARQCYEVGREEERARLELVLAEKDRVIAGQRRMIAEKEQQIAERRRIIAEKEQEMAENKRMIAELEAKPKAAGLWAENTD